jgi:hypothetical protein
VKDVKLKLLYLPRFCKDFQILEKIRIEELIFIHFMTWWVEEDKRWIKEKGIFEPGWAL